LERTQELRQRLERLLAEAAVVEVELSRADGAIRGVPHYSVIEGRAHALGKRLSCAVQRRQMRELTAGQSSAAKRPGCGERCELQSGKRELQSVDGWSQYLAMNYRVKGTEMFWNDPEGGEAILPIRAATLSDDDRLSKPVHTRPGHPFTRRPKSPLSPAESRKC